MNIEKSNKLIAEFMGWRYQPQVTERYYQWWHDGKHWQKHLVFDSSWDWLMPVVKKIENTCNDQDVIINGNSCTLLSWSDEENCFEFYSREDTKLKATYKAAVEFIKWYNKQEQA
jgi:hypothetical protein